MDWSKDKIIKTVKEIRGNFNNLTVQDIENNYKDFKEKFPKLYEFTLDKNFDIQILFQMLNHRDNSEKNNTSDFIRDVSISDSLAKKYLYPTFGEPTVEQKKIAAKKLLKKHYDSEGNRK